MVGAAKQGQAGATKSGATPGDIKSSGAVQVVRMAAPMQGPPVGSAKSTTVLGADSGQKRWTKTARGDFLDILAATCNVHHAARVAGVSYRAVYQERRRNAAFAAAWTDALALGYQMLETHVLGHLLAGNGAEDEITLGHGGGETQIAFAEALKLLTTYRNASGKPTRGGPGRKFAQPEDTDAQLLKRLSQIARTPRKGAAGGDTNKDVDEDEVAR